MKINDMRIEEIFTSSLEDIIQESDEFILKSALDTILLNIKSVLERNKRATFTLNQVISELNLTSDSVYVNPMDDDRRNNIIQAFEQHGMDVERGSGNITLQHMNATQTDGEEQEKVQQTQKVAGKAMDKVRRDSEDGGMEL